MTDRDASPQTAPLPLAVDLDGTLLATDLLHESLLELARSQPWRLLQLPIWLRHGKAGFKRRLAELARPDVASLPVHADVLAWLKRERAAGRPIILASASDQRLVDAVVSHFPCFDEGLGSDGRINLGGAGKQAALVQRYGEQGFEYAGNGRVDLPVWAASAHAHLVEVPAGVAGRVERLGRPMTLHSRRAGRLQALLQAIRPQQWLKNLLVFVPLITAQVTASDAWALALLAFLALSLTASGVYLLNDLIDLPHDRAHPRKRARPLASGRLPLLVGMGMSPLLMLAGLAVAASVSLALVILLLIYLLATSLYSLILKRFALVDVFVLAGLYTLRIVAGGVAAGVVLSEWLIAFSIFTFLSLAIVKRYGELTDAVAHQRPPAPGRGYRADDLRLLASLGAAAAFSAVLIFSLYISSDTVQALYSQPLLLWGAALLVLLWLCHMLLVSHRGEMHDDPVVFAVRDPISLSLGVGCAGFFFAAV